MNRTTRSVLVLRAAALALCLIVLPGATGVRASEIRLPYGPGEFAQFAVKYGIIRAGTATLSVDEATFAGRPALHLVSTARSARFFDRIFRVDDRVESFTSADAQRSYRFERHIREGSYRKDEVVVFNHDLGKAVYSDGEKVDLVQDALCVLGAFYWVRTRDLQPGTDLHLNNHLDRENRRLRVRVLRRETVEVPAGTFPCVVVEPMLESAGIFRSEGSLTIWLTDDARRLPVRMRSKVKVGAITAELESFRSGTPAPPRGE